MKINEHKWNNLLDKYIDAAMAELHRKYLAEQQERKKLLNKVIEMQGNIRVYCRVRPLNSKEIAGNIPRYTNWNSKLKTKLNIFRNISFILIQTIFILFTYFIYCYCIIIILVLLML